jgi:hypothetical protein
MRRNQEYVYAFGIADGDTREAVDLIRILANPRARRSAHVTVRGPYQEPLTRDEIHKLDSMLRRASVALTSAGCFFEGRQNTVYFNCEGPVLHVVWDKHSVGFTPHLTIYDGPSRQFARDLLQILDSLSLWVRFRPSGLQEIELGKHVVGDPLTYVLGTPLARRLGVGGLRIGELEAIEPAVRLRKVTAVAAEFERLYARRNRRQSG